jgi:hypothetical protein
MKPKFPNNTYVKKKSGSWWEGYVVGHYSTFDNPDGVAVQLPIPNGPVQIYPAAALVEYSPRKIEMVEMYDSHIPQPTK